MKFNHAVLIFNPKSGQDNITETQVAEKAGEISAKLTTYTLDENLDLKSTTAKEAQNGADLFIACGGDGTILAVAEALYNKNIPLVVLPYGTANVFAAELGIPANSLKILDLIRDDKLKRRKVDMGLVGDRKFLLRLGIGWEAVMTNETPDILKKNIGRVSYLATALNKRNDLKRSTYVIKTEDYKKKVSGISFMVCNSGNLGLPDLKLLPSIHVDDGKLNVVVIKKSSTKSILQLLGNLVFNYSRKKKSTIDDYILTSFPAKEIIIEKDPGQPAAVDGEMINCEYPLTVKVLENALEVIVPE